MTGRSDLPPAPPARFRLPKQNLGVLDASRRERALAFARAFLEAPTAPYHEDFTSAVVRRFAAERPGLEITVDRHENLVVSWPGTKRKRASAPLAFSAHLDHPGFRYAGKRRGVHTARLHGGVPARFLPGAALRFFTPAGTACATARVKNAAAHGETGVVAELTDVRGRIARGSFGVFDLSDGHVRGTRLYARVCDDLMGAAAILVLLDECARSNAARRVSGVFTRAEETGFVGCIGLLQERILPSETIIVGLECSPRRATARVGHGPVIRVGDRMSVFDPAVTTELLEAAKRVAERVSGFRWQRALMDGGSCESTAYQAFGLRAGAMCLALGNYHNCGPAETIAPEYVDWRDFEGLVGILLECAQSFDISCSAGNTRRRLEQLHARDAGLLAASADRLRRKSRVRTKTKGAAR